MVKTPANPGGLPKEVLTDFRRSSPPIARNSIATIPEGPFYGYNRPGAKASEAINPELGGARA